MFTSLTFEQVLIPDHILSEAEEEWAPDNDPIFQLVPPDFQIIVSKCYDDLGKPAVTFDKFWEVYCNLRDRVEEVISEDIVVSLNQSIFSESVVEGPFALAHLKAPEIDMRNAVDVEGEGEGGDGNDIFHWNFTVDKDQDELY